MNQAILVGRLTSEPEMITMESGKIKTVITLAVNRPFKNSNGIYEADFIRCILWNGIAQNTNDYCHKGDIVGIKGRIQTSTYEKDDETKYMTEVLVERITFITHSKKDDEDQSNSSS